MKQLLIIILICLMTASLSLGQENYTVLKVSAENAPNVDGEIESIWNAVTMVILEKDVDDGTRTTEKDPDIGDYKVEFGLLWSEDGLFILTIIEDDIFVNDNDKEWWKDDDINFLIPADLTSTGASPLEFAWLVMSDEEGKAVPYQNVPIENVTGVWKNMGTTYTFEAFINWDAFTGTVSDDTEILFEARARDDDKEGEAIYPQSFLQWSTEQKNVEKDGVGAGTLLLSTDEATVVSSHYSSSYENNIVEIYPNPAVNKLNVKFQGNVNGDIIGRIFDVSGKPIMALNDINPGLNNIKSIDISTLKNGIYFIELKNSKFISQHILHVQK